MTEPTFLGLLHNAALLLAMALVLDVISASQKKKESTLDRIILGVLLGSFGIAVMLTPWVFVPGIIFDTRSVLLCISGLYFGTLPTLIAMGMTAVLRISQGGAAAVMGVSVICATGLIGILWRQRLGKPLAELKLGELYLFGLLVHLVMLALTLTLPWETALQVLASISLPVMAIYPVGTALLGWLLSSRLHRERVADALAVSNERLQMVVQASNIAIFERNLETGQTHYSPEWKKQLGYENDELSPDSQEWEKRLHPDDLQPALDRFNSFIANRQKNYESEFRLRHKDGSYRSILARGLFQYNEKGQALRLLGCDIDITNQKITEQNLKKSEEQYRMLTENLKDVVWIMDVESMTYRYVSPSVEKMRGYTVEEILAQPVGFSFTEKNRTAYSNRIRSRAEDFLSGKTPADQFYVSEVEQPCKDGSTMWAEVITGYYINPENGRVEGRGITRDISERKQAEAKMQAAQAELQRLLDEADSSRLVLLSLVEDQRRAEDAVRLLNFELEQRVRERTTQLESTNHELESFAYSVSHDLRAPLRAMDGFSAALLNDYQDRLDEQGKHYLERIQAASRRMGQLINDLLSLSRVTRTEFVRQKVDLSELARDIAANLKEAAGLHPLEIEITPGLVVDGDAHLLKIALENLLNNAIKFSSRREITKIQVGLAENQLVPTYYVRDNGVGFDMAYAGKLFAPFQRLHGIEEFPGTGIGLVTVQRIIHRHGGQIWPEAALNQGATFYFTLGETE